MNAPPFPLNPSIGEWFQNWVWNGARWVCSRASGIRVVTTTFTASGPYQPSPGLVSVAVECIGGGGGGGAAGPPSNATYLLTGGGGGSGGYSRSTLPAALVRGGVLVTVGDGGGSGTDGGTTAFGALCVANGGKAGADNGGSGGPTNPYGQGGNGGVPGTGDVTFAGAVGDDGDTDVYSGTDEWVMAKEPRGGTMFGGNFGRTYMVGQGDWGPGSAAYPNSGAGGNGGILNQFAAPNAIVGGAGGSGLCIVTEYCWADAASDGEDCVDPRTVNVNARLSFDPHGPGPGPKPPRPPGPPGWRPNPFGDEDDPYEG